MLGAEVTPQITSIAPVCRHLARRVHQRQQRTQHLRLLAATGTATEQGVASLQGTSRKRNEDRYSLQVPLNGEGGLVGYAGVFDGHGGYAVSEWLQQNLLTYIQKDWESSNVRESLSEAFRLADTKLLASKPGFFGAMGERGVGGSKCGATGAIALLLGSGPGRPKQVLAANVGDSRVVLIRGKKALQLTRDHIPDDEEERERIEATNPNPKRPLVRYVGGTWRVGGILALSRAFGDAYLKGSLQFEGVGTRGSGDYSSGFGVVAEPYTTVTDFKSEDSWLVIASDGLFENEVRGGGGGLDNQQVADFVLQHARDWNPSRIANELAEAAVAEQSTDDITVIVVRLPK